jgi:uncharacterized protein (TIGR02145 family)
MRYIYNVLIALIILFKITHHASAQLIVWGSVHEKVKQELVKSNNARRSIKDSLIELNHQIDFLNKKLQECDLKYNTIGLIKIGNNYWDPADFNEIVTRSGDTLKYAKNKEEWKKYFNDSVPCYTKIPTNTGNEYTSGCLYNYWAVKNFNDWGPDNKRIPTKSDFNDLTKYLKETFYNNDSAKVAEDNMATHVKSIKNWFQYTGTNKTGLNLIPGGFYSNDGFSESKTNYWLVSDAQEKEIEAMSIADFNNKISIFKRQREDNYGYLIRCVKK